LCKTLQERGMTPRVALRRGNLLSFDSVVVGDLADEPDWRAALDGVDFVVHLAARVHVMRESSRDPLTEFRRVNRDATLRLARQASELGVKRFIYLSSIKVNGEQTAETPFRETDQPNPSDPYAISKFEAEQGLLEMAREGPLAVTIIRPPLVYGPGVTGNFLRMLNWVARGYPIPFGAVDNKRTLVALDNLVDLIFICLTSDRAANEVFLAGDGSDFSSGELIEAIAAAMGRPSRLLPVAPALLKVVGRLLGQGASVRRLLDSLQVDTSKAQTVLDWKPPVRPEQAIKGTVDWYFRDDR
jgi:nucleoside-diphosphate-sugar epimerase